MVPEFSQPIVNATLNSGKLKFPVISCSLSSLNRVSFLQNIIFKGEITPLTRYIYSIRAFVFYHKPPKGI